MKTAIYARVSTALKQDPETQLLPLRQFCLQRNWEPIEFVDEISAVKKRPAFEGMLAEARAGRIQCIVVVKLDRLFRSMAEFARALKDLNEWNVRLVCTDQAIDTDQSTPGGTLLMHILAAFAEFERSLIQERVKAGISRARAQGKPWGGRPRKIINLDQVQTLWKSGYTMSEIGRLIGCNRNIVSHALGFDKRKE